MKSHTTYYQQWYSIHLNQACTDDTLKRKSVHVFESLARLAYNKGTALFRGNDPLLRSAAATFSSIINTPYRHTQHARHGSDRNGDRNKAKPLVYSACPWTNTSPRRGLFCRSISCVISLYRARRLHAFFFFFFASHYYCWMLIPIKLELNWIGK